MKNLLLLILLPFQILAHLGTISGTITEKGTQNPLQGATVSLVGFNKKTVTNELGQYIFQNLSSATYKIEITNIGYKTLIVNVIANNDETMFSNFALELSQVQLNEIVISSTKSIDQQLVGKIDTKLRSINNSQEFLRIVPGLFIGQHAGGGKAEQIFLRGFDIDHGTDIQISTDGMPVNMVSHAHGQGYADMHFIIPELVKEVNFKKGVYNASKGNFATAGFVELNTKTTVDKSEIKLEAGQFDSYRALGIFNLLGEKAINNNQAAYLAAEYNFTNGYFENPQAFNRLNLLGKYHGHINKNTVLTASISNFYSKWAASGQIPNRSVENGTIGFYGAIDPNEGGETGRKNLNIQTATNTNNNKLVKNQLYFSNYNFELFSNFTFFLRDSVNGDQIKQKENRNIIGYNGSISGSKIIANKNVNSTIGISFRKDLTNNTELSYTKNKTEKIENIKLGDINELNASVYIDENIQMTEKLAINLGLRFDYFHHEYFDKILNTNGIASNSILSPKLNLNYTFNNRTQLYLNSGKGFHSNDTRVVVAQNGIKTLPAAYGADFGLFFKPFPRLLINPAVWYLWLDQEFVYVGDEGVVEPSGQSRRYGIDFSARLQISNKLYFDLDYNSTKPRAVGEKEGSNYIPLAPINTSTFGLIYQTYKGITGSIRGRYIGNRPANEINTIVAKGYLINDVNLNYSKANYNIGLSIQNVFNTKWKETQFATESRLKNETEAVEEIHFTPGTPFFAKINLSLTF
jgi:TonB dependent receptor/CarboxypepD_reg-like domain/TonB-dependent Receptor Plug Domain